VWPVFASADNPVVTVDLFWGLSSAENGKKGLGIIWKNQ
jgi:hypothetical protein